MNSKKILIPILSVLFGFLIGAVIMLISGYNPIDAYSNLLKGAGFYGDIRRFGDTLLQSTTLILTGLSVAFAFKTGLFNIGASGQMLMGGFGAVIIGIVFELPKIIHLPLAVIVAIIFGALWAFLPGLLKAKYGVHEVVTTIMMNWIAFWSVYYFIQEYFTGSVATESKIINQTASLRVDWMKNLFDGSNVNLGLFLAIIAAIIVWFILEKTTFGFELKAVGFNKDAAQYAGMKVNKNIIYSMMISGALAGLAGATYYLGLTNKMSVGILPQQGFDGIAVALLGMNHPFGILLSGLLFGMMNSGKLFMQSASNVPNELVSIIIAIIIFFAAANSIFEKWINKVFKKSNKKGGKE